MGFSGAPNAVFKRSKFRPKSQEPYVRSREYAKLQKVGVELRANINLRQKQGGKKYKLDGGGREMTRKRRRENEIETTTPSPLLKACAMYGMDIKCQYFQHILLS